MIQSISLHNFMIFQGDSVFSQPLGDNFQDRADYGRRLQLARFPSPRVSSAIENSQRGNEGFEEEDQVYPLVMTITD